MATQPNNPQNDAPTIVRKITTKSIGCNPRKVADGDKSVVLATVGGEAESLEEKESRTDGRVYAQLNGSFVAVNRETGEKFSSSSLILPGVLQDMVAAEVRKIPAGSSFLFAMDIVCAPAPGTSIGYTYQGRPLMHKTHDPQSELWNMLESGNHPKLAIAASNDKEPAKESASTGKSKK